LLLKLSAKGSTGKKENPVRDYDWHNVLFEGCVHRLIIQMCVSKIQRRAWLAQVFEIVCDTNAIKEKQIPFLSADGRVPTYFAAVGVKLSNPKP